jgi:hypothetical protein
VGVSLKVKGPRGKESRGWRKGGGDEEEKKKKEDGWNSMEG